MKKTFLVLLAVITVMTALMFSTVSVNGAESVSNVICNTYINKPLLSEGEIVTVTADMADLYVAEHISLGGDVVSLSDVSSNTNGQDDHIDTFKDGWFLENNVWYYYEENVTVKNDWRKDSVGWCFLDENGEWVLNKFVKDSTGKWAYIAPDGYYYEITDWLWYNECWYYLDNGYRVENDWRLDSVGWCYLGEDGKMLTNTWQLDSVGRCYIGEDGYCIENEWVLDGTGWAYIGSDARMVTTTGWIQYDGGWYYLEGGYRVENDWRFDSIGWCYLDAEGKMVTNAWVRDSTGWCWIGAFGYWDGIYY